MFYASLGGEKDFSLFVECRVLSEFVRFEVNCIK